MERFTTTSPNAASPAEPGGRLQGRSMVAADVAEVELQDAVLLDAGELEGRREPLAPAHGRAPLPDDEDAVTPPLVSVVVRSMDRDLLAEALASIAAQTWPNVEVVVVNAKGGEHSPLPGSEFRFPVSLAGDGRPLQRAASANAGLQAARGRYVLFLDDDDLLLPDHLAKLCGALQEGGVRAAYSGVRMVDVGGNVLALFDEHWELARLRGANFLPIHGVMFERSLVEEGCRFDESLDCLEDWDFWLQVAQRTTFRHVPGISAVYRYGFGQSVLSSNANMETHLETRARIFEKWNANFSSRQWVESIYWFEASLGHARSRAERAETEASALRSHLEAVSNELAALGERHSAAQHALHRTRRAVETAERRIAYLEQAHGMERVRAEAVLSSTSWKLGAPLRMLVRLMRGERREVAVALRARGQRVARAAYRHIPAPLRGPALEAAYRLGGWFLRGTGRYELWRQRRRGEDGATAGGGNAPMTMITIDDVAPCPDAAPGSIAIHLHVYYPDLAGEFAAHLGNMPYPFDLFVSVPDEAARGVCLQAFADVARRARLEVAVVPNRGRDIAPMLCTFGVALRDYDFVAHFHTKKSLYNNGATDGWRPYLLQALLGSERRIRQVFALLGRHGMVFPQSFHAVPYAANTWLANRHHGVALTARMGLPNFPSGYFHFPVGSMFWARGETLRPLLECGIGLEEFPEEAGQTDGTLAHGIERMLGVLAMNRGGEGAAVLRDVTQPSWSAWRFDQYLARPREAVEERIRSQDIRIVIFDVFDTLLVRPLLDPEDVKEIVARRAGEHGAVYLQWRAVAEAAARDRARRDVGLEAIFSELAALARLDSGTARHLMRIEAAVEGAVVGVRDHGRELLDLALREGKRVLLASDTYLPQELVADMLASVGVHGWHEIYLSSETGARKDTGGLYRHILEREGLAPGEVLMIGDNERSDIQLPHDLGLNVLHVLRPVDLARSLPRLSALIDRPRNEDRLDRSLALGMVVRRAFEPVFFDRFDPGSLVARGDAAAIGYSVLGPFTLAFTQWLLDRARADGVERLYFLAREGQFLKAVYDRVCRDVEGAPASAYLVVSRRAVNLPAIRDRADIDEVARSPFGPAGLDMFLEERFGVTLSEEERALLKRRRLLPALSEVLVRGNDIEAVGPLLDLLEPRILATAAGERDAMKAYLARMGLTGGGRYAVVDIGYAGTIQNRLIRILGAAIDGYYMVTDERAARIEEVHGAGALGCYCHRASITGEIPVALKDSFAAEKLLSAHDPQVVKYGLLEDGTPQPVFKELSPQELSTRRLREEVREAAMCFVEDALETSLALSIDFKVPTDLALELFEAFVSHTSEAEREVLAGFSLDDHFCGRGVVS